MKNYHMDIHHKNYEIYRIVVVHKLKNNTPTKINHVILYVIWMQQFNTTYTIQMNTKESNNQMFKMTQ